MRRFVPVTLGIVFLSIPLFPAFITLTGVSVPGISLVPRPVTVGLVAFVFAIAVYWSFVLAAAPGPLPPTAVALAMFPAAGVAAALLGFDPLAGALFIVILSFGVTWHALILRFFREPHVAATIYCCFLLSGALAATAAVVMVLTKIPNGVYTVGHGRAIGTFILPGELAGFLIVYLPLAYALARVAPRRDLRTLAGAGAAVGAIAFVLTFSRAGWVGLAAAVAFFVFMQRRAGGRYAIAVLGIAVVALGFAFNARHDPSENFTRISIWQAAFAMIERFPLTGVGPFEFAQIYQLLRLPDGEPTAFHAHSFVSMVAAETGLVGVAAVLYGWWRFATLFRAGLRAATGTPMIAIAIAAGLVGTWVQGLIDTVSLVIFALWYPFMALALAELEGARPHDAPARVATPQRVAATAHTRRRALVGTAVALAAIPCALVQLASGATFARAGAGLSLPAHLAPNVGTQIYSALERVAPLPFVEAMLTRGALQRGDLDTAAAHAARMRAGTLRSEDQARIALARGRPDDAIEKFLDAGDDRALQAYVEQLSASGRTRDAYRLERRIRDRLAASKTRPNAVADSWWRLGRLAARLALPREAADDYAAASALAPLNTKYLIDAGTLALAQREPDAARSSFARAVDIDPASADSVAGLGLAALDRGDRAQAHALAERALQVNPRASLAVRLQRALEPPR